MGHRAFLRAGSINKFPQFPSGSILRSLYSHRFHTTFFSAMHLLLVGACAHSSFETWASEHGKYYASREETEQRRQIFEANRQFVLHHNKHFAENLETYSVALNLFADLTTAEFRRRHASHASIPPRSWLVPAPLAVHDAPAAMDWRERGAVTEIKDQGRCGSVGV
eukprot:5456760-Prymnesium_polylepis.1